MSEDFIARFPVPIALVPGASFKWNLHEAADNFFKLTADCLGRGIPRWLPSAFRPLVYDLKIQPSYYNPWLLLSNATNGVFS